MTQAFGPYTGTVEVVHDGDTVHAKLDVGFDLTVYTRIRILGINAPELATPAGKTAAEYARTLLHPGDTIRVTSHGWDKYGGRIDGDITLPDDRDYATLMVAAGHAKPWDGVGIKPV
jgi:endonuclease YncB( thermonuclease family)